MSASSDMTPTDLDRKARGLFKAMMSAPYGTTSVGDIVCAETTSNRLEAAWLPLITAALRLAVPDGFVVVPAVLTDEMLKAGHTAQWSAPPDGDYHGTPSTSMNSIYRHIYAAQIAAAPSVSEGEVSGG